MADTWGKKLINRIYPVVYSTVEENAKFSVKPNMFVYSEVFN